MFCPACAIALRGRGRRKAACRLFNGPPPAEEDRQSRRLARRRVSADRAIIDTKPAIVGSGTAFKKPLA
jgi:hypothetical protein